MSVNHWFQHLPIYVKKMLGTKKFDYYVSFYFSKFCFHRLKGTPVHGCSSCKFSLQNELKDLNPYIDEIQRAVNQDFSLDQMIRVQRHYEGNDEEFLIAVMDLHVILDGGIGEVKRRFHDRWDQMLEEYQ